MICLHCKKEYNSRGKNYCSRECFRLDVKNNPTIFKNGHKPVLDQSGEKNNQWKGDKVGYSGLHYWIRRALGNPKKCEMCGITDKEWYDWANISHKYNRDISDWIRLCRSCHTKYDRKVK